MTVTVQCSGGHHQQAEADFAEAETEQLGDLVNSEFVFEAEASRVSEWGAGAGLATRGQPKRDITARARSGGRKQ